MCLTIPLYILVIKEFIMSTMYDMSDKARFFVWNYIRTHLDKSDPEPNFRIYEVWQLLYSR